MGNGNSTETKESRRSKIRHKLQNLRSRRRLRRPRSGSVSRFSSQRSVSQEDFDSIALLTQIGAEMKFKDKWLACVSFGEQTFRTETSDSTDRPIWNSKKLLLEKNGPTLARISVFETNRLLKNNIIGYCELDPLDFVVQEPDSTCKSFDLLDPASSNVVGCMFLSCSVEDNVQTETCFAKRIFSIVDYNEDGHLSFSEFSDLMNAFG